MEEAKAIKRKTGESVIGNWRMASTINIQEYPRLDRKGINHTLQLVAASYRVLPHEIT